MADILLLLQEEGGRRRRRERIFRDRLDPLDRPDNEIWRKNRFTRAGLLCLVDQLAPALSHPTARNCSLTVLQQVCVALNFYATGAVLDSPSTVHGISRATASATINKVSRAIHITMKNVPFLDILLINRPMA